MWLPKPQTEERKTFLNEMQFNELDTYYYERILLKKLKKGKPPPNGTLSIYQLDIKLKTSSKTCSTLSNHKLAIVSQY